jgi:ribosome-associated protein
MMRKKPMTKNKITLAEIITKLEDLKAENITTIDLSGKSSICDYMLITNGTSNRHVSSIAEKLVEFLKHERKTPYLVEGVNEGQWVLIETNNIVIHIFLPETREYYNLETLFGK